MKLNVYFGSKKAGKLESTENRGIVFSYFEEYISETNQKLSISLPIIENRNFLKSVVFNFLIGNCDSHGKNYSILYKNNKIELSPLYDAVSTTIYSGLTDKLSMKIGKHYEIQKVCKEDFENLAETLGIKSSMIFSIFSEFNKKLPEVKSTLINDEKINKELLERIFEGIKSREDFKN